VIFARVKKLTGEVLFEKSLDSFPVSVGRDPTAGLSIRDNGVSTRHAEIDWDGVRLTFRDVGSRNGSFHDKREVKEIALTLPCTFVLGNVVALELAAPNGAKAEASPAAYVAPKPFKVATPMPSPPAPVVPEVPSVIAGQAKALEELPEGGFGWEEFWLRLERVSWREFGIAMGVLSGLFLFLHLVIFRDLALGPVTASLASVIGSLITGALFAALLALPGLVGRRTYAFKPLFFQMSVATMLYLISEEIFWPALLFESVGTFFRLCFLPVVGVIWFSFWYVWLFSVFPHRFEKRLFTASIALALLLSLFHLRTVFTVDRQSLLRSALLGELKVSRSLAGPVADVRDLTDEIKDFGRKFPPK